MRARAFPGCIVLSAFAVTGVWADPVLPQYRVTPLATPAGAAWAIPKAMNAAGNVAGDTPTSGVMWVGEVLVEIPLLPGADRMDVRALNSQGEVVGRAVNSGGVSTAFYFDQDAVVDLFPQSVVGEDAVAVDINDAGLIAGSATFLDAESGSLVQHAVVWQPGDSLATVIESPDISGASTAIAVNNAGQVLVQAGQASFLWQDGVVTGLGVLNMAMLDFNDAAAIAGFVLNEEDGRWLAVVYADEWFNVLHTLGGEDAQAWGLNNAGHAVGAAQIPTGQWHATLWTDETPIDLHELVADRIDGTLTLARRINDAGQIVAQSSGNEVFSSTWLLTPVTPDLDGDGVVGIGDLLQLLADWGPCACPSDLDGDGAVGMSDFLLLLENWG